MKSDTGVIDAYGISYFSWKMGVLQCSQPIDGMSTAFIVSGVKELVERFSFESSGGRISYLRRKGDYPVLFIHGFTSSSESWEVLNRYLDNSLDLIYVDLFGHGKSGTPAPGEYSPEVQSLIKLQASSLSELVSHLGLKDFAIVGSSLGGWVSMELGVNFRRPVCMVLLDTAGVAPTGDQEFLDGFASLIRDYVESGEGFAEVLMEILKNYNPEESLMMDGTLPQRADFDVSVIWGEDDPLLNVKYGRKFAGELQRSEFHVIENAGHTPFRSHPMRVAGLINSFVLPDRTSSTI